MSADSPRRGLHKGAQVISPQPIVDRSIIDSVAGIINDIVPQAYAATPNSDNKESISWARFEYADVNDPALYPDFNEGSSTPPLLLVLGYTTGVQVWLIAATGEATEVLSWRPGIVRTLRILPNPKTDEEHADLFEAKRPMVAICDSAGPGPQFCNISFISLKTGEQAKSIKFKNPVCDILANRRSVVVTFLEKIAVFDARTLEDVLTVTTCYASPGPNPNPVALGTRWLAYSEKKLLPVKRSSGGCEGEGVQSYTATVLYAAKSLGKGLRGLGETVASSLSGNSVSPVVVNNTGSDVTQPGVITILDLQAAKEEKELDDVNIETVIAHFTAHSDAIVAMTFDLSGALLMTADKRGHDFHVFRIQPHPGGPTLAAVHHLYVLHRGDTTAKVQDMVFSSDTRWAAISTVRGTTHVFPVAPYGGPVGIRTHSTPHVVNRLSRFHRSAGLMDDGTRSHSPVSHTELPLSVYPYSNPRLPPYPHPTVLHPLAQIRQPSTLNHINSQAQQSRPQQRQRLHSDDSGTLPLKICAYFAPPRAWMYAQRESTTKVIKRAVDSLFIMACHGNMIQYDLEPKPAAGVPKEKVCDDTMIELEVEAKGQWPLLRSPDSLEIVPPLPTSSPLLCVSTIPKDIHDVESAEDRWLSQVEIVTHAGPHRRLWMGPQFVFKTYNATSGVPVNLVEAEAIEIGVTGGSRPARSNPVNMPHAASRSLVPVVIDGSGSSYEQSPRFMEAYGDSLENENVGIGSGENQLREDLAEAMLETSIAPHRAPGRRLVFERVGQPVTKVVNPLGTVITVSADEEDVNSSQEFDTAEESHVPEPPRSVCAEEGPASLGDLELESQTLRDLTEICAEMRSASEPAINNVPDENICEVKEQKALCVEIAPICNTAGTSIDFEKADAFRDVPTSLSLCAEQGAIPSSPMTQAKETAWCKGFGKVEGAGTHERNFSEAQFVVNCDEESVVLMENRITHARKSSSVRREDVPRKSCETERAVKKSARSSFTTEPGAVRGNVEHKTQVKKYILKERDDSIVIEDSLCMEERKEKGCVDEKKRKGCGEKSANIETKSKSVDSKTDESPKEAVGKFKSKSKSSVSYETPTKDVTSENGSTKSKNSKKRSDPNVKIQEVGHLVEDSLVKKEKCKSIENVESTIMGTEETKSSPMEPSLDGFSSIEYHMIESTYCKSGGTSNQSDEDMEHIHSSEISKIPTEFMEADKCTDVTSCTESSPILQRKNSKNTISDDDMEYIHTSELTEVSDCNIHKDDSRLTDTDRMSECDTSTSTRNSKQIVSSDDDLEHIHHSDVCALTFDTALIKDTCEKTLKKSEEMTTDQAYKTKSTKKYKDIVVIESDTSAADVTVIVKPLEGWSKTKKQEVTEKKSVEDYDEFGSFRDAPVAERNSSPLRKVKTRVSKVNSSATAPKRSPAGNVTIIDIDAMQKAEMETSMDITPTPECKILSAPHEGCATRTKKSRKSRKSHVESSAQSIISPEITASGSSKTMESLDNKKLESNWQESQTSFSDMSWSAIVKKKSIPSAEADAGSEPDFKSFVEIDAKSSDMENSTSNPVVEKAETEQGITQDSLVDKTADDENQCVQFENIDDSSSSFPSLIVIDELQESANDLGFWKPVVKKKNSSVTDEVEVTDDPDTLSATEDVKQFDLTIEETESTSKKQDTLFWSSVVKKIKATSEEVETKDDSDIVPTSKDVQEPNPSLEETKTRKKKDVSLNSSNTSSQETKLPIDKVSPEVSITASSDDSFLNLTSNDISVQDRQKKTDESFVKLEVIKEVEEEASDDDRNKHEDDQVPVVDLTSSKEDSLEPERDHEPEKRSDSEQEVVPERSSSSDELNANTVFPNMESDYTGREAVEKSNSNCPTTSSSVSSTAKKGIRSKKKKRR